MANAVTSGIWPSVSASLSGLNGLGTERIRWGSGGGKQSGYRFEGRSVPVLLDGSEFTLGTFTHENFPVMGIPTDPFDVDLTVNIAFGESDIERAFSFRFRHTETDNAGPNPDDEVDLSTLQSQETVTIDGREYAVLIRGFVQNSQLVTKFISPENGSNKADIVATFALVGLKAEYFNNKDLAGKPALTRTDPTVDFDWGWSSPDPLIERDTFSARWSGQIQAQHSETYTFYTATDDGVRLWVDGKLLIDEWHEQWLDSGQFVNGLPTEGLAGVHTGKIDLIAGKRYDIKMEYFGDIERSVAKLYWESASTPKEIVPQSQLYP